MTRTVLLLACCFWSLTLPATDTIKILKSQWCPYICNDGQHAPSGFITESIAHILTQSGYQLEYFELNYARGLQLIQSGELDLVLGIFKEEAQNIIINNTPVAYSHNFFYTQQNSNWQFNDSQSLNQITLGAVQGYNYINEGLNQHIENEQGETVIVVSGSKAQTRLLQLLHRGRIDTFLDDVLVINHELSLLPQPLNLRIAGRTQGAAPVYVGLSPHMKNATSLINLLDAKLTQREQDPVMVQIKNKYEIIVSHAEHNPNGLVISPEVKSIPQDMSLISATLLLKESTNESTLHPN